ncbi:MAG TPA: hypothetical protein VGL62_02930, partial [Vicinamibacterales bacterium]
LLASGSVTLTTVCLLAPHLTGDNHQELLANARHKSKREVERMAATIRAAAARAVIGAQAAGDAGAQTVCRHTPTRRWTGG